MRTNVSLITMGAGNVLALKNTLDSFSEIFDEVIYGDLLLFDDDRKVVKSYQQQYNLKIVKLPFDYIYHNGFSSVLNKLAEHCTNDFVIYMNTSEIIEPGKNYGILEHMSYDYNCYSFNHSIDPHTWYRIYNRNELKWDGLIHEQVIGYHRPYPNSLFTMSDLDKDMGDPFKAKVFNDTKELVYFNQYIKLVEHPELIGTTNMGWVNYAKDGYESLKERINKKGKRYEAFETGNLEMYLNDIFTNSEFEQERFENSNLIHYQK